MDDKPGTLAEVAEILGRAGINIEGGCGYPAIGRGIFHLLVEDETGAKNALELAGVTVSEEMEVMVLDIPNNPGMLGRTLGKFGNEGINIRLFYIASNNRIVLSVDDIEKARRIDLDQ